jgi:hypothetical protein
MDYSRHPTVPEIDEVRRTFFSRSADDRPSGRVRARTRQPVEVRKAKSRLRTAAWRSDLHRKRRPEGATCALAFLNAVVDVARHLGREDLEVFRESEMAFQHALGTLERLGFNRQECIAVFKRLTRRDSTGMWGSEGAVSVNNI